MPFETVLSEDQLSFSQQMISFIETSVMKGSILDKHKDVLRQMVGSSAVENHSTFPKGRHPHKPAGKCR